MYIRTFYTHLNSNLNTQFWLANNSFIYYVTSSGPEKDYLKTGTSFTIGRTSEPVDVRKTVERATLSEP